MNKQQPKILCVCEGGTVRSGALAWSLRHNFGLVRVLQASHSKTLQEDLDLLGAWADYIVVMEPKFSDKFTAFKGKVRVLDVGPDIWKNPLHADLQNIVSEAAQKWDSSGWEI